MLIRVIVFLLINFGALGIGGLYTDAGSDWYLELNKAPWTPPGWVFGAAWTTIMVCFSFYMAFLWSDRQNRKIILGLYTIQWILNVAWSPLFFYCHQVTAGLAVITGLTLLIAYLLLNYWNILKAKSLLILPYFLWLLIATSLNGYVFFNN